MLEGKIILITGSSRGIGAATARLAAAYGAKVILHGKTESEELIALAEELDTMYFVCDITDRDQVFEKVSNLFTLFPRIDALCNIAGAVAPKNFLESTKEDWLLPYETNVLGTVYFCQSIIPYMQKEKKGTIVNIASVRAYPQGTLASRLPYSASKASIINISAALAKEFAKDGIRVNSVSPGGVNTDIAKTWDEATIKRNTNVPLSRLGEPKEIGEMICFLVSDRASYVTGQDYPVDGGYIIGN